MLLFGSPARSGAARGIILPMFSIVRFILLLLLTTIPLAARAQQPWTFAVSGDSRNCGDVVMPAIAAGAHHDRAAFYWHLGDFRAIYDFDQDYRQLATAGGSPLLIIDYENHAWDDFIENQLTPFGGTPVYLGIGNHETIPPKTRSEFLIQFADWLDTPELKQQRLKDNSNDHRLKTYYHWWHDGVDFINLDNASPDQFDKEQLAWFERVLQADAGDPSIPTIVVGMHAALPDSLSKGHSMSETPQGEASGRRVYADLLQPPKDRSQAGLRSRQPLPLFDGRYLQYRVPGPTHACFRDGSSALPARSAASCHPTPLTPRPRKPMSTAICSQP